MTRLSRTTLGRLTLTLACAGTACATPSTQSKTATETPAAAATEQPEASPPVLKGELPVRETLSPEARSALTARMDRHGEAMTFLLASLIFLQYDDVDYLAKQIAGEPKLGRPAPGDKDSLNALLPASFFDYQDQLTISVAELSAAAQSHDDMKLVDAFGKVARTCVACHSAYLHDDIAPEEDGPSGHGPSLSGAF